MPKRNSASPPRPEMVSAVNEMLAKLEQISPDPSLVGRCPELPGIVLDRVMSSPLDRAGSEYKQVGNDYEKLRSESLKPLPPHPRGRAPALRAVVPAGVKAMKRDMLRHELPALA